MLFESTEKMVHQKRDNSNRISVILTTQEDIQKFRSEISAQPKQEQIREMW